MCRANCHTKTLLSGPGTYQHDIFSFLLVGLGEHWLLGWRDRCGLSGLRRVCRNYWWRPVQRSPPPIHGTCRHARQRSRSSANPPPSLSAGAPMGACFSDLGALSLHRLERVQATVAPLAEKNLGAVVLSAVLSRFGPGAKPASRSRLSHKNLPQSLLAIAIYLYLSIPQGFKAQRKEKLT